MKVRCTQVLTSTDVSIKFGKRWYEFGFMNYKERDELAKELENAAAAIRNGESYKDDESV